MRIIAGEFGGRVLQAPRGRDTRPTSDRVREALFSILGDVSGLKVLDLYAGSGALGFEALSRGAESVTFVEQARPALAAIRHNAETLGVGTRARVIAGDVSKALERLAREEYGFAIVLLDPPYALPGVPQVLQAIRRKKVVRTGGLTVHEHSSRVAPHDGISGLNPRSTRVYGDTALTFYYWRTMEDR